MTYFTMTGPELRDAVIAGEPGAQIEIDRRAANKAAKRGQVAVEPAMEEQTIDDALLTFKGWLDRMPIEAEARLKIYSDLYDSIREAVGEDLGPVSGILLSR